MRINEYNSSPLLNKKKNKLIYKKYIYNLFKYNEEKRKNYIQIKMKNKNLMFVLKILLLQKEKNQKNILFCNIIHMKMLLKI